MSLAFVGITLNIKNNRDYPIRINVLGSPVNPLDTVNATTEYRWDITAFTPSISDTLTLEYKPVGAAVFSTFTYEINNTNIDALITALDALGIGYFQSYTELGQLYLSTYNDNVVFGLLTITNNGAPATSTTTTTTTAGPTTSTTTTTTTSAPTTSTTTTSTTAAPTSTTTTTTTAAPTSTTTTTTTAAPTSTTTTTTTAAPTTSTTTTTTTTAISFAIGYLNFNGGNSYTGYGSNTLSCAAGGSGSIVTVYSNAPIADGVILYLDSALTQPISSTGGYYWASGGIGIYYYFTLGGSGDVVGFTDCASLITSTTTTTTTAVGFVNVDVYAEQNNNVGNRRIWYSTDQFATYTQLTTSVTNVGNLVGIVSVPVGTTLYFVLGDTIDPFDGVTPISLKVSTPNDYAAVPVSCNYVGWVSTQVFVPENVNLNGNSLSFDLACSINAVTTTTSTTTSTTTAASTTTTTTSTTTLPTANITITNGSLDISISQVDFNGVTATYVAGQALPNTTGNGTDLFTTQVGTFTLDVYRSNTIAGQHITVTDSVGNIQCSFFGAGSATESFTNVVYDGSNPIQIDAQDGPCGTSVPVNWSWTNNNVVETPPFGGGYIEISVNSIVVVNQTDTSSTTTTNYSNSLNVNVGDTVLVTIYAYANNTYGTETQLKVDSPSGTTLYNNTDTQPLAGSPSTNSYLFVATSAQIFITAASNSY